MGRYRTCVVYGCEDRTSHRHLFPNPNKFPEMFRRWIIACGNNSLATMSAEDVYRTKRVCHAHFTASDVSSNMYLKKTAVPSLHVPVRYEAETLQQKMSAEETDYALHGDNSPSTSSGKTGQPDRPELTYLSETAQTTDDTRCIPSTSSVKMQEPIMQHYDSNVSGIAHKRPGSILHDVGVTRGTNLSPTAKKLYAKTLTLQKSVRRLKTRSLKTKIQALKKDELIDKAIINLEPHVAQFIKSQLRVHSKHSKGRRYTLNDKCLALILYKQSPVAYNTFAKLFDVPSRKTITTLLQHIPLTVGIHENTFKTMKDIVKSFKASEKLCVLVFDEIAIQPNVTFNSHQLCFEGFEDLGDSSSNKTADHAIVFMLRGVTKDWKQPVAYGFSQNTIKTIDLVRMLKQIVTKSHDIGLQVIATVSDQGGSNAAAINYLMKNSVTETDYPNRKCYKINNELIYHIFDPPHLIKGIRNNLLTKQLTWVDKDDTKIATWADIYNAYMLDNASGELRLMPKLSEQHCNPEKIKKMKVSCATQVLSHSMAAAINVFVKTGVTNDSGLTLNASAIGTAKILKFFDSLFDSVNGNSFYPRHGKILRCAMSTTSKHHEFFPVAIQALRSMYFTKSGKKYIPPSLKNWIVTIHGLQDLFRTVQSKISFLRLRVFNQDPLENFFGQMRQRGGRNINPTSTQLQTQFKSLLINNLTSRHSINANCEEDTLIIITNIKQFITKRHVQETDVFQLTEEISNKVNSLTTNITAIDAFAISYVSGYLCKRLKTLYECETCKKNLICTNIEEAWHGFQQAKEYLQELPLRLKYATPQLIQGLFTAYSMLKILLPEVAAEKNGFATILLILQNNVHFNFLHKCAHIDAIQIRILKQFAMLVAHNWANGINKILTGKDCRYKGADVVYINAQKYVLKRCNK